MNKFVTFTVLVLIAACSPAPTTASLATPLIPTNEPIITASPQVVLPTAAIQPIATIPGVPEPSSTQMTTSALWLQVLSPQDDSVVDAPEVDVIGSAPAGAVISVNDDILIVGADLQFKTTVSLDEGPNLIEVIASDEDGNEVFALLAVTYEP